MHDPSPIKDFKCRRCGEVLCQTDGKKIVVEFEGNTIAEVWTGSVLFRCRGCGLKTTWRQQKTLTFTP